MIESIFKMFDRKRPVCPALLINALNELLKVMVDFEIAFSVGLRVEIQIAQAKGVHPGLIDALLDHVHHFKSLLIKNNVFRFLGIHFLIK